MTLIKTANDDDLGQLICFKTIAIIFGLGVCFLQILSPAFHFQKQPALPKQGYIASAFIQLCYPMLKSSSQAAGDVENMQELYKECFGLGFLIAVNSPFLANG